MLITSPKTSYIGHWPGLLSFAVVIVLFSQGMHGQTVTTSGGTSGTIPVFTDTGAIGNSSITDSGASVYFSKPINASVLNVGNVLSSGILLSTTSSDEGGAVEIVNPLKTAAGTANRWSIYNMTNSYGNSLQFWDYDTIGCASGGMCASRLTLMDSGNVGIGKSTPAYTLDVNGPINASSFLVNGVPLGSISTSSPSFTGNVGIGTTAAQSSLHVASPEVPVTSNEQAFGNGNVLIQATGARSTIAGAALTFATAANTDGSNTWEQGRIITVGDNENNGDASGRMVLQTRYNGASGWEWNNNLVLTSNGSVGIGTSTPGASLDVAGNVKISGSGASLTFPDGTVQSTAYSGSGCVTGTTIGPATAPTGSCSTNGAWVFSQDGHATFCANGTWVAKI